MLKIQLTEKDESAGNHVHVKKKKRKHLDSEIILKKECSAVFFSSSTSCKCEMTEQFYTAYLSLCKTWTLGRKLLLLL